MKNKKIEELQKQIDRLNRYKNGVSYHQIIAKNDTEVYQSVVADELGEDINAFEEKQELIRGGYKVKMFHLRDVVMKK